MDRIPKYPKLKWIGFAAVPTVAFAGITAAVILSRPQEVKPETQNTIVLSMVDTLSFEVDETQQNVYFCNPMENSTDIVITIQDGNSVLYESGKMTPGEELRMITLKRKVRESDTSFTVSYACYEGEEIVETIHTTAQVIVQ